MPLRRLASSLLLVLVATACGTAEGTDVTSERVVRPDVRVRPTPAPLTAPLTGEGFPSPQDWQGRAALAIKVENTPVSRPQSGLDAADVVYEELAEGGVTRFVAVFHSRDASPVGPVRSARSVDPVILSPIGGLFGYSGGVPAIVAAVRGTSSITDVGADRAASAYRRDRSRKAPHNLYTTTEALWDGRDGDPPSPMFTFSELGDDAPDGKPAPTFSFAFAGNGDTVRYTYDEGAGAYLRSHGSKPHTVADGDQLAVTNVVVQSVAITRGSTVDQAGQTTMDTSVIGEGRAILFRDGKAYEGVWRRASHGSKTTFVGEDGEPMVFGRGNTWIELVPRTQSVTIG